MTHYCHLTTGDGFFAGCLRHSAKADIHSAKPLPRQNLCRGKQFIGKDLFVEYTLSGTRQRKVAVTASATVTVALLSVKVKHSAKVAALSSAIDSDTQQRWPLCRVPPARHSANRRPLPSAWPVALGKSVMFAECNGLCTRQSMFPGSHFAECHCHCTRQSD